MQKTRIVVLLGLFALLASNRPAFSQDSIQEEEITRWFSDSRFGMFLTFGLYSIPGGVWEGRVAGRNMNAEWIQKQGNWPYGISAEDYQALAKQFNPTRFNADEWIREVKNAGMKYFLVTAKHHDGFALWPSKVSKYDVADATPFQRDILAELAEACRKYDVKLGFYYSHWQDWEHEGGAKPPADVFHSIPRPVQITDEQFEKLELRRPRILTLQRLSFRVRGATPDRPPTPMPRAGSGPTLPLSTNWPRSTVETTRAN